MRRLAESMTSFHNSIRRTGMSLAIAFLLVLTVFAFTSQANAQGIVVSDFEDGQMDGWTQNGNPTTLQVSTEMAHGGSRSLKIAGRANSWDGVSMNLLPIVKPGEAWVVSAWVRLAPGSAPDKISLQVHDDVDSSGWGGYPLASYPDGITVTDQAWVQLKGRYPNAGTLNAGGTVLTLAFNPDHTATNYYVDDFVIYKQEPSGCFISPDTTGDSSDFENELNWAQRTWSNVAVSLTNADAHSGLQSLIQTGRTQPWNTAGYFGAGKMCNGSTYKISVWAKMAPGAPAADLNVQAKTTKAGQSDGYLNLTSTQTVDDQGWVKLSGTFDMKTDYDDLWIYVNPTSDATSSFYVDDFSLTYVPPATGIESIPSIAQAYQSSFPVGAAVYAPDVTPGDVHSDLLVRHFSSVTPENDMKWNVIEPTENVFDYTKADAIVSFARDQNMAVRGHTLVWHQQTPDWVFKDANGVDMSTLPYSDENKALLFARMKNHINALITHFGADVTSWDVVNEAFDDSSDGVDGFRNSKWYIISGGPSYIDEAFKDAKEAVDAAGLSGTVKLYLNDYNTTVPSKLNAITGYLTSAKAAGVPIDGVGHQFHNKLDWPVNDDPASLNAVTGAIDAVASLGLDNQITEMEISIYRTGSTQTYQSYADLVANLQNDLTVQGYRYHDYFAAFKQLAAAGKLSSVTLWGEADDHTWLTSMSKTDAPLPFDKDLVHKPAYTGIMDPASLPNAIPHVSNADVTVQFNTATAITLSASDTDPLTLTIVTEPTHGTLSVISGSSVTYTPTTDYFGPDSFTFIANDGKVDSDLGQININVFPAVPVAQDMSVTANTNVAKPITLVATGDGTLAWTIVTPPLHGTLTGTAPDLSYVSANNYAGDDSFTFKVNNSLDSNIATVSINVVDLLVPVANDQSITVDYLTPTPIKLTATGNGPFTYTIVKLPKGKGTVTATAQPDTFMYINDPDTDPYLTTEGDNLDSITFKVNNGHESQIATVSITLRPASLKVNLASGQASSQTISGGGSATYNLLVHGYKTYSRHSLPGVTFVCGGLPNFATCSVTPNGATLDDEMTPVPFSVTIKTNTAAAAAALTLPPSSLPWVPVALAATFALGLITMNRAKMQWRLVGACAVLVVVATFAACGGGSTQSKASNDTVSTPAGTYTITVTAVATRNVSGAQSDWRITGDIPLTLKVN